MKPSRPAPDSGPFPLLEALRLQLAAEGRPPSRAKLAALIAAGAARVEGRCLRDPAALVAPGARVSFDPEASDIAESGGHESDGDGEARSPVLARLRGPRPPSRAPLPAGVLFADPQLVVIERAQFAATDAAALSAEVAALLKREVLHTVEDPSAPGAGPVLLAGSKAVRQHLEADLREGRLRETLLSLRTPVQPGPGEAVLERGQFEERGQVVPFGLLRREEAPPAAPPLGARELAPAQRLALVLKHPRTNRRLAFEVTPSARFLDACSRLGISGGPGGE